MGTVSCCCERRACALHLSAVTPLMAMQPAESKLETSSASRQGGRASEGCMGQGLRAPSKNLHACMHAQTQLHAWDQARRGNRD